jgi:hypothetical protein
LQLNEQKIKSIFPRASKSFIDANARLQDTEPERTIRYGVLEKGARKNKSSGRIILSYSSARQRLLDIDNLTGGTKFLTDALRYCGAIPGDQEDQITLQVSQKKVASKAEEKTTLQITWPE